jgi:hypothetical protein
MDYRAAGREEARRALQMTVATLAFLDCDGSAGQTLVTAVAGCVVRRYAGGRMFEMIGAAFTFRDGMTGHATHSRN